MCCQAMRLQRNNVAVFIRWQNAEANWCDTNYYSNLDENYTITYSLDFTLRTQTMCSEELGSLAGDKQLFIPLGFYKGCKVAIKRIHEKNIHLNREQMLELKKVRIQNMCMLK